MSKIKIPYDAIFKSIFGNPNVVKSFLQDFIPGGYIDDLNFSTMESIATNHITENFEERYNDIVWRISWNKTRKTCYIVVMLEFQRDVDYWMALRMNAYTALLQQSRKKTEQPPAWTPLPFVLPIVIYIGEKKWNAPLNVAEMYEPDIPEELRPYIPSHKYFLLDTTCFPKKVLIKLHGIVAQIVKFRCEKAPQKLIEIYNELNSLVQRPEYADIQKPISLLGSCFLQQIGVTEDLSHCNVKELNAMIESRINTWKKMYIDEGMAKGKKEGREEGREEREQQMLAQQRVQIINLLKDRFGTVPLPLLASIETTTDSSALMVFYALAYSANSLQDFELQAERKLSGARD